MTVGEILKDVLLKAEEEKDGIPPNVKEMPVEDLLLAYYSRIKEKRETPLELGLDFFVLGISMGIDFMRGLKDDTKEIK